MAGIIPTDDHAELAPSSAPIWGNCSGSVQAQRGRPNKETPETRKGTAGHWVGESVLRTLLQAEPGPAVCGDYVGEVAPNGVVVTDDIADGAQVYVDYVIERLEALSPSTQFVIEERVYMPELHEKNWGTTDFGFWDPHNGVLGAVDYKGGHRDTRPEKNFQLIDYLWGLCKRFGITGDMHANIRVELIIVQPFCFSAAGSVKTWAVTLSDLRGYWNTLYAQAHAAFSNPTLTTGIWCRDCTGRVDCAAATAAGMNFIDLVEQPYGMAEKSSPDLALERAMLKDAISVARARLDSIEDELALRVQNGDIETGLTLEATAGRLEFTCSIEQAIAFGDLMGVNIRKEATITPTQAIKKAPKEKRAAFEAALKTITRRPPGALTLTPVADSRTARAFSRK